MTKRMRNFRLLHLFLTAVLVIPLVVLGLQACGGEQVVDYATVTKMEADEFQALLSKATDDLVGHLGGDEAGFYAVILALDQGYDMYQILTGSLNNRIDADGRITNVYGLPILPARTPEGIIEPSRENADRGARRQATIPAPYGVRLAAISSPPLLVADSPFEPQDRIAALARSCNLELVDELAREILGEKEREWRKALRAREQAFQAEQEELQEQIYILENSYSVTDTTMRLGALGYSVQQILEAILLDKVQFEPDEDWTYGGSCWYIEHSPGVVLKPANPPVDVLGSLVCVMAEDDAPTEFPAEDVAAAVADAEARVASSNGAQGAAPVSEATTTTSITAPDADGVANGTYVGDVSVILPFMQGAIGSFDELSEIAVELQVTDDSIMATVEFTERWPGKIIGTDPVCITTVRCLYFGQGPVTNPLSLVMTTEPEIVAIGDKCQPDYEEWLANFLSYMQELTLVGTFSDGVFAGNLGERYGVDAAIGR